jgi:histidinol phosphatase-like PHP family hydrolase
MGGKFTLSDDSHGIAQVGLNFGRALDYLRSLGVETLHYLEREKADSKAELEPSLVVREVSLADLDVKEYPHT